jgi:hypothetical protein
VIDIRLQILRAELSRAMNRAPQAVAQELSKGFRTVGARFERFMVRERLRKDGRPTYNDPRDRLFRRTGALSRAYNTVLTGAGNLDQLTLRMGWIDPKAAAVARVQEEGAIIRPVRAKYLTVPLPAALTAAGVLRARARDWPNTFIVRTKKGGLFIAHQVGGKPEFLFALKKEVKVPPRLGFVDNWQGSEWSQARIEILQESVETALKSVGLT